MEETKLIIREKFSVYKRQILGVLSIVVGAFVLLFFKAGSNTEEYLVAEQKFQMFKKDPSDVAYLEMKKAFKKAPEIERKYGAMIAQELFQRNHLADALALASKSIEFMQLEAPFHASFGQTSLLIEQGMFQDALEKSVSLKEFMITQMESSLAQDTSTNAGCVLYAHNLLRIACLQKELSNKPGEKAAWDELEQFLQSHQSVQVQVMSSFKDNGLDLSHYILERKKVL